VFIGVLKGCVYFFTDLTRHLSSVAELDFIQVSSYGHSTSSSGSIVLVKDITIDVRDRDVYLVEDIVDTGTTLADVITLIRARHPRSLRVVALLSKPSRRVVSVHVDHLGMEVEDVFVVGYGLDYAEKYHNRPTSAVDSRRRPLGQQWPVTCSPLAALSPARAGGSCAGSGIARMP
jgi:hypoxanthine phosphoribosyltransferase